MDNAHSYLKKQAVTCCDENAFNDQACRRYGNDDAYQGDHETTTSVLGLRFGWGGYGRHLVGYRARWALDRPWWVAATAHGRIGPCMG